MTFGYKYKNPQGLDEQIACNGHKKWYRRTFGPFGYGAWKAVSPPLVVDSHIKLDGEYIPVQPLRNKPLGLPN